MIGKCRPGMLSRCFGGPPARPICAILLLAISSCDGRRALGTSSGGDTQQPSSTHHSAKSAFAEHLGSSTTSPQEPPPPGPPMASFSPMPEHGPPEGGCYCTNLHHGRDWANSCYVTFAECENVRYWHGRDLNTRRRSRGTALSCRHEVGQACQQTRCVASQSKPTGDAKCTRWWGRPGQI